MKKNIKRTDSYNQCSVKRNYSSKVDYESKNIQTSEYTEQHSAQRENVISYNEETDIYFRHALETLKSGIAEDEREIFVRNVLEQTDGQELQLSCHSTTSYCLELLLDEADDLNVIIRFMKAFSKNLVTACGNCFASHITETLIYHGLTHMQTWSSDVEAAENNTENVKLAEKAESVVFIISWIHSLGEFCLKNFHTCLEDTYGCHVLRTVTQALGGYYISEGVNQSKRAKGQKKHFEMEYLGSENKLKQKTSIALDAIPKFFVTMLKKLLKAFIRLDDIKDYAVEPRTAPVIQVLLFVLKKRLPKRCKKFIDILSATLFENLSHEGIPDALVHKNCSYVVEKIFDSATDDQLSELWKKYIEPFLESLLKHPVGNYIVQRIFDVVQGKTEFETICSSVFPFFDLILETRHFGIWLSMAAACNRLKVQQAQFMKHLMQCLDCQEPENQQLYLVPLLLNFEKYGNYIIRKKSSIDIQITLQGSLLIQALLKFQKPLKVVKSLLNMKAEELAFLANHMQGCHILLSFFDSVNVGEKNKDKCLHILKPILTTIACDPNGNLTLARMWMLLTLKQKTVIAAELSNNNELLQKSRYGFGISKKFGLFYFKCKNDQWKDFQQNLAKKRLHSDV